MSARRFAIYFTPAADSPLGKFGAAVLGYDSQGARAVERSALPGIPAGEAESLTASPARYGFHATLKAPFSLEISRTVGELREFVGSFAGRRHAVEMGRLRVEPLGAFLALRPDGRDRELGELAADCMRTFDVFRAPMSRVERERCLKAGLSTRQIELLDRWGYPYILEEFRFHMTLAGPLPEGRRADWLEALSAKFQPLAGERFSLDSVALMMQDDRESPFRVLHVAPLRG
jgi:putative phosphonate metabolism protein